MTEFGDFNPFQSGPIDESLFTPVRPSEEVRDFVGANPELDLGAALIFLVNTFPQVEGGQASWLLDGGAVVKLVTTPDRPINDIDIVTRRTDLADKFANSGHFDAKDVRSWLEVKGIDYSDELAERVMGSGIKVGLRHTGKFISIIPPEIIALTKTPPYTYEARPQRQQDAEDIRSLGVTQAQMDIMAGRLGLVA